MDAKLQRGSDSMKPLRFVLALFMTMAISAPIYANEAQNAYKRGVRAESEKQYDTAYEAFKQAYTLRPKDARYAAAFLRTRAYAAIEHVQHGRVLRDESELQEALAEFQQATEIDGSNFVAKQELRLTADMLRRQGQEAVAASAKPESQLAKMAREAEGPVELEPVTNTPITLRMTTTADNVYKTIGKLAGINVLFDLDYKPQRITIELNDVMFREALGMVALESKTFWRPISTTAILVASESKRKEFEQNVMKTFYLRNASTSGELQEVVSTLKGILDITRVQVNPTHSAITLRGTPDQMVLAEKLVSDIDKPKAEVIIDITVMQVNRDRLHTLGTVVPTSTSISLQTAATGGLAGLTKVGSLNGSNFVIPGPSASFSFLMSDSNTKVLQNPEVRALDNERASLKIGDRVPIATGSFTPGIGGGGISPLVNTQFQYLDVGVNIDITPHVHSDHEVTLKMVLEISSVTGSQNIGGISQPVIGQRRIEHETRLQDGDINLVGGILEDSETRSLSGYPWLANIPILKYLFGQENKDRRQDEIVFAITPHIVRAEEITDENLRLIDIGTGNTVGLRYKEPKPTKPSSTPTPGTGSAQRRVPQRPGEPVPPSAPH
jgi:general secretion pathway protein D